MARAADSFFESDKDNEPVALPQRDDLAEEDTFAEQMRRDGEDPDSWRGASRGDSGTVLVEADWEEQADAPPEDLFYEVGRLITDALGITDNRPFDQGELVQIASSSIPCSQVSQTCAGRTKSRRKPSRECSATCASRANGSAGRTGRS